MAVTVNELIEELRAFPPYCPVRLEVKGEMADCEGIASETLWTESDGMVGHYLHWLLLSDFPDKPREEGDAIPK